MRNPFTFIFTGLLILCFQLNAQNTGIINRIATAPAGRLVLDPNGDGYTSASPAGFGASDVTNSEIIFSSVPSFSIEPFGDLRRGADHRYSDFVPDNNGNGVYMTYQGSNLLFRFRVGSVIPGSKGYSILIDTDNKFGATGPNADPNYIAATTGTNGNPGFEIEVVLETNSRIAVYNADGTSTPSLIKSYTNWQDMSQVSVAGTFDNGDPDFFIDFYIPFADLQAAPFNLTTSSSLRFCATTVMSPQSAIGGPKSDIYGLSDDNYTGTNDQYEAYIKAQAPVTIGTLSSGFGALCTEAPTVNTPLGTGTVAVTGSWTMSALTGAKNTATITVYKNGSLIGTVSNIGTGATWTLPAVTLANGDIVTAKAQATAESMCLLSNAVTASTCNSSNKPATPLLNCYATTKGITGTNLSTGWTIHTDNLTRSIADDNVTNSSALFAAPTGTSPNLNWTYSSGCTGGSPLTSGSYKVYYTNNITGCASEPAYVCVAGSGGNALAGSLAVPTITSPVNGNITTATTAISGTASASSSLYLYVDGIITQTTTVTAGGTFSFSNLSYSSGQVIYIVSEYNTGTVSTSKCEAQTAKITVSCYTTPPAINTDNNNQVTAGAAISGTSGESAGTVIRVYTSSSTLVATTSVQANGTWSTGNAGTTPATYTAVASTIYYAIAQKGSCGTSTASGNVTAAAATNNSRCGTITGPVTAGSTTVSGTVTGSVANTLVNLYEDGTNIGSITTGTTAWTITVPATALYPNGVLTIGLQESGLQETSCAATATVNCASLPTAPVISPSNFTVAANQSVTYNITNAVTGYFYGIADAASGMSLANGVWAASNGNLSITTIPFSSSGNYNVAIKATTLSGLNVCSSGPAASNVTVNAALPVRFLTLTGTKTSAAVMIRWTVSNEQNVNYYEVEKSADCNHFESAGRVKYSAPAAGLYSLQDAIPVAEKECYRIKQVDIDGTSHYSKIIIVSTLNAMASMQIVPNPVHQSTTLLIQLPKEGSGSIKVTDMMGKVVKEKTIFVRAGSNLVLLNGLDPLPAGVYHVEFVMDGQLLSANILKQ